MQKLRFEDELEYKKLLRMTPQDFDEILGLIQVAYPKQPAANIKLAATILFLTTGDNYTKLQYQFRVHASTLSN